jgi:hypothetical protein
MEYESVTQKVILPAESWLGTTLQTVVCGIPNCKEARLVDFCGLQENISCIRSTSSCVVLSLPPPFLCRTLPVS